MFKQTVSLLLLLWLLLSQGGPLSSVSWGQEHPDPLWQHNSYDRRVQEVGLRILKANQIHQIILFQVSRSTNIDDINAHADQRKNMVIVSRGLLRYLSSDDELAAVLGHEVGHILANHGYRNAGKRIIARGALMALALGEIAATGSGAAPITTTTGMATKVGLNRSNQAYELEADRIGLHLMVQAGYNPLAAEDLFQKIGSEHTFRFWATHPVNSKRIAQIHQLIATYYPQFLQEDNLQTEENPRGYPAPPNRIEYQVHPTLPVGEYPKQPYPTQPTEWKAPVTPLPQHSTANPPPFPQTASTTLPSAPEQQTPWEAQVPEYLKKYIEPTSP